MPYRVLSFEPTPNPNALKCLLDRPISDRPRSFRSAADAAGDPIASAVFAIPGVTSLLMGGGWVTVNKSPEAGWGPIKQAVTKVLAGAPEPPA